MRTILNYSLCLLGLLGLSACQTVHKNTKQSVKATSNTVNAKIYCTGTERCSFERVDDIQILDHHTGWLTAQALRQGIIRAERFSLFDYQVMSFYLSVPPKSHEVMISFYPISKYRAEKFTVIHDFKAGQQYTFKMYRQRSHKAGNLLTVSAPEPLCIDLLQEQLVLRRFCRPHDALTGLGEFVEQKLNSVS